MHRAVPRSTDEKRRRADERTKVADYEAGSTR
jgi:hypothetical protein